LIDGARKKGALDAGRGEGTLSFDPRTIATSSEQDASGSENRLTRETSNTFSVAERVGFDRSVTASPRFLFQRASAEALRATMVKKNRQRSRAAFGEISGIRRIFNIGTTIGARLKMTSEARSKTAQW